MNGFSKPESYDRFREVLTSSGYTAPQLRETLGISELQNPRDADIPALLWQVRDDEPVKVLIRLFVIGTRIPRALIESQWTPALLEDALHAGIVAAQGDQIVGRIRLTPFQQFWFAHDRPVSREEPVAADFVMGIGASTTTLAALTVRRPVARMLDLGCGCGTHAILAASHAREAIGSDLNPRATAFTQFNAKLNNLPNVTTATGSLFEPLQGNFELIISNPPFVISPGGKYIYRDSGESGDHFVQTVIRASAARLAEGGFAQILCNWAHYKNVVTQDRLRAWFEGSGCDVWVMESETRNAAVYAKTWLASTEDTTLETFASEFTRWMEHYEHLGIEQVSAGAIMLRKRSASSNFVEFHHSPPRMSGAAGDDVAQWFEARVFLNSTNDAALLDSAFDVSSSVRMRQDFHRADGRWSPTNGELFKSHGLAYSAAMDNYFAGLLARCDGRATIGELAGGLAQAIGRSQDEVIPHLLPIIRDLIGKGFLVYNAKH